MLAGDNVETQPLLDILSAPVPATPAAEEKQTTPQLSAEEKREQFQNDKRSKDLRDDNDKPSSTGKERKKPDAYKEVFTDSDCEARDFDQ